MKKENMREVEFFIVRRQSAVPRNGAGADADGREVAGSFGIRSRVRAAAGERPDLCRQLPRRPADGMRCAKKLPAGFSILDNRPG